MNYLDTTNKAQCKLRIFKEEMIPDYISVLPQTQMVICDVRRLPSYEFPFPSEASLGAA